MKNLLSVAIAFLCVALPSAANVQLRVEAPDYPGQQATLYAYMDLFSRRLEPIAKGTTDANGTVVLDAEVAGTQKALLLLGNVGAELWLRQGSYHVQMPTTVRGQVRTVGGSTRVDLVFPGLDMLDVNALMSDLNARLDAFVAEGLATDPDAGMGAIAQMRDGSSPLTPDTLHQGRSLYLTPTWERARVDTFGGKLRKFYGDVDDPWFQQNLAYGIAGLYLGPRAQDRELYERFLEGKPVRYDVPEYVRFFSAFFTDHLLRFPFRTRPEAVKGFVQEGNADSLKALLARHDFLQDDRICELVLITNLYENAANGELNGPGVLKVLRQVAAHSAYAEHRAMAGNMLWDLTAMTKGTDLPRVALMDSDGKPVPWEGVTSGHTCLMVTKVGNPYSEHEIIAMDQLVGEYRDQITFVYVVLDRTAEQLAAWLKANPGYGGMWVLPVDQQGMLDLWRVKSAPVLYLQQDGILTASPGPLPSQGLMAELHRIRVGMQREQQLNRDRGRPSPRR